jgi:hypothetical protein
MLIRISPILLGHHPDQVRVLGHYLPEQFVLPVERCYQREHDRGQWLPWLRRGWPSA